MEDFEYSVEICDRDWDCFFAECEECNLLPPSLAGVDDSGMSDIDEGSIFAKRVQKVGVTTGFSEAHHHMDGSPDCEDSPMEHYLSKHCVGGMESVLSGSEEDIHLQSVNIFFERLKNATEAERLIEPSQARARKNREAMQEDEERCTDGQQASSTALPKNIPKLNSLPARGETAVGKESTQPVDTISNIMKTVKKDEPSSNIFPGPAASTSVLKTNISAHPETKLFIIEEACAETRVNEASRWSQTHDSLDGVETTPHNDTVIKVEMCTPLDDVKQEDFLTCQSTLGKKPSTDSWSSLEMVTKVKWTEDTTSTNKTAIQDLSPSASIKRKRRKKRRLSVEPSENVHGYDRQVLFKPSDSEEERYACRGGTGPCAPEDIHLLYLNEAQKNVMPALTAHASTSNLPVKVTAKEIKVNDLSHHRPTCESIGREGRCKATGLAENTAANSKTVTPLKQTDDCVISAKNCRGNVATNVQPCNKLQVEESTGLNKHPECPVSITDGGNGESDLTTETANCGKKDSCVVTRQQFDQMNHSIGCCENEKSFTAEVKSPTHSISQSSEPKDRIVEIVQNGKLSTAKSVLAEEAVNSGRGKYTLCQREAEPQQQLEMNCHQYNSSLGKTHCPLSANGTSTSGTCYTKPKQYETGARPFLEETSLQVDCAKFTFDSSNAMPEKCILSETPSSLDVNIPVQQTEHPLMCHTAVEGAELPAPQTITCHNGNLCSEMSLTDKSQRGTKSSLSEDLLTSLSDIAPVSSCSALDTESVMSLSNEHITDSDLSQSVSQNDLRGQGEKTSLILPKHEEGVLTSRSISQAVSSEAPDSKCDVVLEADAVTASKEEYEAEKAPDSKHSVFAMSSFWSEMEKLTINDIIGLRMISKAAPPSCLPPLKEVEHSGKFALTDSAFFTQLDESRPEQTKEDSSSDLNPVKSSSVSVSSRGIVWEREPVRLGADIYPEKMLLTSVSGISQPALPDSTQTCLRKICKNVSVHNLHAMETLSYTCKGQTLQTINEGDLEKVEYFADGHMPKQDKDVDCFASSATNSYRISLSNIFQYLFGGKQSSPTQSAADNITTFYTDGNSVPETYDHFFSEFDTESFLCPLITAEDQAKDELVPVFSYSRSANNNLQFPEVYDCFFPSSSSDESSVESDEEDPSGPIRVVKRFSRTSSASKISTDIYENFFTDGDLRQNFFWKNTFSFRNISFAGSIVQKQTVSNPVVPMRPSGRPLQSTVHSVNVLGNRDVMFSDPLLYHLEDRVSTQLAQQPFRYEDLQTAISNPRLDASLLPLRQSDMCLVCIAFASWVLKTANPQVGDAWKAVLLANVSALSAIRYLRKYVKMEAAASERKLHCNTPSDS